MNGKHRQIARQTRCYAITPKGATVESGLEPRKIVIGEYLTRQRNKRAGLKQVVVLTYLGQGYGCGRG